MNGPSRTAPAATPRRDEPEEQLRLHNKSSGDNLQDILITRRKKRSPDGKSDETIREAVRADGDRLSGRHWRKSKGGSDSKCLEPRERKVLLLKIIFELVSEMSTKRASVSIYATN